MPRDGAITFRDIAGKLTVLRIERDPARGVMRHAHSSCEPAWGKNQPEQDIPREPSRLLNAVP